MGGSVGEIAQTVLTQPAFVFQHLLVPTKIAFVLQPLVPLALAPLGGAEVAALALPALGYVLLSDDPLQVSIRTQYPAPLVPYMFFAAVVAVRRILRFKVLGGSASPASLARRRAAAGVLIGTASLANYLIQSPAPLSMSFDPQQFVSSSRQAEASSLLARVPADAAVLADSPFVRHLSQRTAVHQIPDVFDIRKIEYVLADTRFDPYPAYGSLRSDILSSPIFQPLAQEDGFVLERRAPFTPEHALAIPFGRQITLLGYTIETTVPARAGAAVSFVLVWRADQDLQRRFVVFVHLIDARDHIWAQGDQEPANGWLRTD